MATYTPDQMYGAGIQGETISGSTLFTFTNPGGSSYFTVETVQDSTGSVNGKQATTSGSWVEVTPGMGTINSQYFAAAVIPPGTSSLAFTPASPVTGSNYRFKGTGGFTMTTFNPSSSLFAAGEKGVWFDASDLSTMFQDSAGTIPVTAVGQKVGKWLDKSGNGNHAVQATTANQPTYQIDNEGNPNVTFTRTTPTQLVVASMDLSTTNKVTVCAGLNVTDQSGNAGAPVEFGDVGTGNGTFLIGAPSSTADHSIYLRGSTANIQARVANIVDGDDILTALLDISLGAGTRELQLIPRLNYVQIPTANITWTPASGGTGPGVNFGTWPLYLGARSGLGTPYGGKIYQLIVRGAASTTAQVYQIEAFTDSKLD